MERDPHMLIEGMLIAAYALGAKTNYIYTRGEYKYLIDIMDVALDEARAAGLLGEKILGTDFSCEIYTHTGAGAYICGEETALLEFAGRHARPSAHETSLPCHLRSLRFADCRQQRRDADCRARHHQDGRRGLSKTGH